MNGRGSAGRRLHITGASGVGATTLGRGLAGRLSCAHFDTDDYYWLATDPPYRLKREAPERLRLLGEVLEAASAWVLSGSLDGWGDPLIPIFDLVVFLHAPTALRLRRLRERERLRYGAAALAPGGSMHEQHEAFLAWAAAYDDGSQEGRSRPRHEAWLATLSCSILRIDGAMSIDTQIERILRGGVRN
jgi:adenylate kinase family enzyme